MEVDFRTKRAGRAKPWNWPHRKKGLGLGGSSIRILYRVWNTPERFDHRSDCLLPRGRDRLRTARPIHSSAYPRTLGLFTTARPTYHRSACLLPRGRDRLPGGGFCE
eukprot:258548-Chlamydomonas_euryale.AAC.1